MSATAVVDIQTHPPVMSKVKAKRKLTRQEKKALPLLPHRPSAEVLVAGQQFAAVLLRHGYRYNEGMSIASFSMVDTAMLNAGRVKTAAAEKLGISREHVQMVHERGADMARK